MPQAAVVSPGGRGDALPAPRWNGEADTIRGGCAGRKGSNSHELVTAAPGSVNWECVGVQTPLGVSPADSDTLQLRLFGSVL